MSQKNRFGRLFSGLSSDLIEIREYTRRHAELREAHHFLFALPTDGFDPNLPIELVLMGTNPGESPACWKFLRTPMQEESFEFDFHRGSSGATSGRKNWMSKVSRFLPPGNILQTELFFWSSQNLELFEERFGKISRTPHLTFCTKKNKKLLMAADPKAVVFSGLGQAQLASKLYNLQHIRTESCAVSGKKLAEQFTDGFRNWFFVPHLSGARGYTNLQRDICKEIILQGIS